MTNIKLFIIVALALFVAGFAPAPASAAISDTCALLPSITTVVSLPFTNGILG